MRLLVLRHLEFSLSDNDTLQCVEEGGDFSFTLTSDEVVRLLEFIIDCEEDPSSSDDMSS